MNIIDRLLSLGVLEFTLVLISVVLIVDYFARLSIAYHKAVTTKTDSKGMAHLPYQEGNKFYKW